MYAVKVDVDKTMYFELTLQDDLPSNETFQKVLSLSWLLTTF